MSVLVGRKAPDFTVPAVLGNGEIVDKYNLHEHLKGKYGLVFFYPLDFTFVCPSELIALDKRMNEFKSRNVEVVAVIHRFSFYPQCLSHGCESGRDWSCKLHNGC